MEEKSCHPKLFEIGCQNIIPLDRIGCQNIIPLEIGCQNIIPLVTMQTLLLPKTLK